jgi:hypothetical protein
MCSQVSVAQTIFAELHVPHLVTRASDAHLVLEDSTIILVDELEVHTITCARSHAHVTTCAGPQRHAST